MAVAFFSVALGALVAWLPGGIHRGLGPIRTFAFVSVTTVVVVHLFPSALAENGIYALLGLAMGLWGPNLVEKIAQWWLGRDLRDRPEDEELCVRVATEVGYVGLIVHAMGDGVALWAYAAQAQPQLDVAIALAAHNVPVTALLVLRFATTHGTMSAMLRALGLALAAILGVLIADEVPESLLPMLEPWVASVVSGLLLHVMLHGLRSSPPNTKTLRTVDFFAALLGGALPLWTMNTGQSMHETYNLHHKFQEALVDLTLESAPMLLLGLAAGAAIQTLGARIPHRWLHQGSTSRQAMLGAVMGAPLPICACGVLPIVQSLHIQGASAAFAVSFLLTTPELGIETFALTGYMMGWPFAFLRLIAAIAAGFVGAWTVATVSQHVSKKESSSEAPHAHAHAHSEPTGTDALHFGKTRTFFHALNELIGHVGPWIVIGLLAAAYLEATLSPDRLTSLHSVWELALVTVIAVPSYVCASSATPLAAVLISKGMSVGAALTGLLLGPATNVATLLFLRRTYGAKAAWLGLLAMVGFVWTVALLVNYFFPKSLLISSATLQQHTHSWMAWLSTAVLMFFILRSLFPVGIRYWFGTLQNSDMTVHHHDHPL